MQARSGTLRGLLPPRGDAVGLEALLRLVDVQHVRRCNGLASDCRGKLVERDRHP